MLHGMAKEQANLLDLSLEQVRVYAHTFISRFDRYPLQLSQGNWIQVNKPLGLNLIEAHLKGEITLGAYALSQDSTASWICFDADEPTQWQTLLSAATRLEQESVPAYPEISRRGGHLWLFLVEKIPGRLIRQLASGLAATFGLEGMEFFPKQNELTTGPGSFVRLPLGMHQKTGRRYHFITPDGSPLAPTIREQMAILASPLPIPEWAFEAYKSHIEPVGKPEPVRLSPTTAKTLSGRIKETVTVYDFVSQYVELDDRGRGHCPFHDDKHKSFAVNKNKNFWNCFAGCGGGSLIDFWSKWREKEGQDPGFIATVTELAEVLL